MCIIEARCVCDCVCDVYVTHLLREDVYVTAYVTPIEGRCVCGARVSSPSTSCGISFY